MNIHDRACKGDTYKEAVCVCVCVEESDWFADGASTLRLILYTQQQERTHSTVDERRGLFLDPCIILEIAREPSELSHFHFAEKRSLL